MLASGGSGPKRSLQYSRGSIGIRLLHEGSQADPLIVGLDAVLGAKALVAFLDRIGRGAVGILAGDITPRAVKEMAPSEQGAELRIRYQLKLILGPIDDRLTALDHPIDPPSQCFAPDRGASGRISVGAASHAHAHGVG